MSTLLDTLLAARDHAEFSATRKGDGPIKSVLRVIEPVARADKIIAAGNAERVKYRTANYTADAAMIYGAQIGYLHGEVRRLCDEIDAHSNPIKAPAGEQWEHIDVRANADLGCALVRCFYDTDGDLMAVFLAGCEMRRDALSELAWDALELAMREEALVYTEANAIEAAIFDRGAL